MERQRSFSFKSTSFFVFAFTISSSLIFLVSLFTWVLRSNPSIHQNTHFQFNKPVFNLSSFSSSSSAESLKLSILKDTHFLKPENESGSVKFSAFNQIQIQRLEDGGSEIEPEEAPAPSMKDIEVGANELTEGDEVTASLKVDEFKAYPSNGKFKEKVMNGCDLTKGKWVYDESYPLYTNGSCPLIDEGFNCDTNGRRDRSYKKWKWQPQDCDFPRFNAAKMLDLIKGKRLVFVGDSINRNQWESMLCMLMGAVKDPKKVYETHGRRITKEKGNYSFKFVDYKCTVEYYVSHFLVHESKARIGQKRRPTLRIDAIDHGSSRWKGADILVFNTAHWWSHYKTKAGINYYQEGNQVHPKLDVSTAFRKALMTWAAWVDRHINPGRTRVFFRNSAPSHFRGGLWNSGGHCAEATRPLNDTSGMEYPEKNGIVEEVILQMKTPVTLLNVTGLSAYRIDGHPSIYGKKPRTQSSNIQDCSHWCLPGVPDTWNEILFFHLQSKQKSKYH
ncbi:TRICHOME BIREFRINGENCE-LIKE 6 [Hibiscus trionum]|uniref:TRICHOME BIREFRINGENCE-LIKE 6 n=1 Tax=Hibiscus trionum TaxID=183268 RepID=A0A9W7IPT9_HIBTR|nr:TRICHOME BIREFRINGENCE-LIKE 6 [Hibiscus trionum]